jgi:Zn ribbon nucleic-acid-binding protein|tara:strand:- start:1233 stop:1409 length:177 start_codon:yes stop_codon:yes gene_type:complete
VEKFVKFFECFNCGHKEHNVYEYFYVFCPECYEPDNFTEIVVEDILPFEMEENDDTEH